MSGDRDRKVEETKQELGCTRCQWLQLNIFKRYSATTEPGTDVETDFYCDVGMKAVLRSIRRFILLKMQLKATKILPNKTETGKIKATCLSFFKTELMGLADQDYLGEVYQNQIMDIMTVFLNLQPEEE